MVLAATEQYDGPRRLVDDDLAEPFLPQSPRAMTRLIRWRTLREWSVGASDRSQPGLWANLSCRKRFIDEKLDAALPDIDAVVILGAELARHGHHTSDRTFFVWENWTAYVLRQ